MQTKCKETQKALYGVINSIYHNFDLFEQTRNVWDTDVPPGAKFKRVAYVHSLVAITIPSLVIIKQTVHKILSGQ